jgi:carboxymethylenebutenolidase
MNPFNKVFLGIILIPFLSFAQKKSCCMQSSTESFAQLSADENFASSHLAPKPFIFEASIGKMISINCATGPAANAFEVKSAKPSNKWIFVFHEWWGLNDYIKREAEKLSAEIPGVNILAIDLYDGIIATTPEEAQSTMGKMKDERSRMIINSSIKYVGNKATIATLGWCMGGGWSLQASLLAGNKAKACVMYYGMPETDPEKISKLSSDVLGIFALKDNWITPEVVDKFKLLMESKGKKIIVKNYEAVHAFANPSNPNYNEELAADAHRNAVEFLLERLK